ncbi:cell division protein FtsB [Pseudohongiella sp. SYSU M77423]|jgi:cell division protein FtsB|uniref:cell division protein FtsB n=1 Tax=unclassified Pseudohongiella TaxID=2629611 RepID=UPI000C4DF604|nr:MULTISPECIES: cell division protein FtsB [unclassified Pseudohongiella]MAY56980.1 cell division protein FtsB [Gammaproteobacteria bacterium]MEC8860976.1 cell division protein FtsB [Pseudomonadota bacterium]HBN14664.1 cell division protein FtsB [Pseudohongiella sp.]MBJ54381.1 cell division protein FtsB [Gammaproteobacteria bacterium]MDH7943252.1 cell division protein FtsB [Pseudohongiella sp. SYSU M77423]|tara:strand:- start:578 stop:847 length:270 start_codon:yes stop_codon:yes gene_type:complete
MKVIVSGLVVVLLLLQWRLWIGEGGVRDLRLLEEQLAAQQAENSALRQRNQLLEREVLDLKNGLDAIEERARSDLGMVGEDETFYMLIE